MSSWWRRGACRASSRACWNGLLRLAGTFQRISLAVHEADDAAFRNLVDGLGLAAKIDVIAAPQGAALWPWPQDRVTVVRGADGSTVVLGCNDPDDYTASAASRACGMEACVSLGSPQPGGNILVDGATCFVGADLSAPRSTPAGRSRSWAARPWSAAGRAASR